MKILWITNFVVPKVALRHDLSSPTSGGWISSMIEKIKDDNRIDLHVILLSKNKTDKKEKIDNVNYHTIGNFNLLNRIKINSKIKSKIKKIIDILNPDIIHVHGTEFVLGNIILSLNIKAKVVFSLQGLVSQYYKKNNYYADVNNYLSQFKISNRLNIKFFLLIKYMMGKFRALNEIKQLKQAKYVIGRTNWDEAHVKYINNNVKYYNDWRPIRPEFINENWDINLIRRNSVFLAGGINNPYKGIHVALIALNKVKAIYPDLKILIPSEDLFLVKPRGYKLFIKKLIIKLQLKDNVEFLGKLNAFNMAKTFSTSHVYILTSSNENSPNTLLESMHVGTPSIVSFIGGVADMGSHNQSYLLYRFGDYCQIYLYLLRILADDTFALNLSESAKSFHREKQKINLADQLIKIYSDLVKL
jgi:L-malate glycosyltransferase